MKHLLANTGVKLLAVVLLVAMLLGLAAGIVGLVALHELGGYYDDSRIMRNRLLASVGWNELDPAQNFYHMMQHPEHHIESDLDYYVARYDPANSNVYFRVTDVDGETVFETSDCTTGMELNHTTEYRNEEVTSETETFRLWDAAERYVAQMAEEHPEINVHFSPDFSTYCDEDGKERIDVTVWYWEKEPEILDFTVYLLPVISARDEYYYTAVLSDTLYGMRDALPWLCVLFGVLALALLIFLLAGVGHRRGYDRIVLRWVDRIPLELYAAALLTAAAAMTMLADQISYIDLALLRMAGIAACCTVIFLLALAGLVSLVVRIKAGCWWRGTLVYLMFRFCWRCVRYAARKLPLYWKAGLVWFGLSFVELLAFLVAYGEGLLLMWVVEKLLLTPLLILAVINMRQLQQAGAKLAEGNLRWPIDKRRMLPTFRQHADHLGSIGNGMQRAVNEQMKSERMKTELITNVSHDIKTPLTSIINYVDLLKKEPLPEGKVQEYVAVLDRQSHRLKKLTDDLVEASKASTGNIPVHAEPTDVNVLLGQVAGEYTERLQAKQLTLIQQPAADAPMILADGRLMWRVMENLLGNVCKYAAPHTRVYFGAERKGSKVTIWVKNISAAPLNISGEELQERFVRGDAARTTEGSGLGLSIARSLTQLQNGFFNILIDGDLFKAVLVFDTIEAPAETEESGLPENGFAE